MTTVFKTSTMTTPSDREICTERVFDAPRDLVWRAYTEPDLLRQWWGRGNQLEIEKYELEKGGHWRFVEHCEEGAFGFEGRFRRISPPECLEQTFEWDGMPGHVAIEKATFEKVDQERTRLRIKALYPTRNDRDEMLRMGMKEGMDQSFQALDGLLERLLKGR